MERCAGDIFEKWEFQGLLYAPAFRWTDLSIYPKYSRRYVSIEYDRKPSTFREYLIFVTVFPKTAEKN